MRYGLSSAEGVPEMASVGGSVKEYQVDLDPDAMCSYGLNLIQIMKAVKNSNVDVDAGTMEINQAEYLIRGLGYVKRHSDLENSPITERNGVPVRVKDVAKVSFGPADRRGGLDKDFFFASVCHGGAGRQDVSSVGFHKDFCLAFVATARSRHSSHACLLGVQPAPTPLASSIQGKKKRYRLNVNISSVVFAYMLSHLLKREGLVRNYLGLAFIVLLATYVLTEHWMPLTPKNGMLVNMAFVLAIIVVVLALLWLMVISVF